MRYLCTSVSSIDRKCLAIRRKSVEGERAGDDGKKEGDHHPSIGYYFLEVGGENRSE